MPKTYPSGGGKQFGPSATPYVTNAPVKECRSIAGRWSVSLRHFSYSNITLPASRYHMLHVEKWHLPRPLLDDYLCPTRNMDIVLFPSRSFPSECLFSPRESVLSGMAYVRSECCWLVLFYVNTLLSTLVKFLNGNMCHICEIFYTYFPTDSKNLISVLKILSLLLLLPYSVAQYLNISRLNSLTSISLSAFGYWIYFSFVWGLYF